MMPGVVKDRVAKRRNGEIVPLTAEQSDRLASLYEECGARLVRYALSLLTRYGRKGAGARALAEDIAQSMWVQVAREGARGPLGEDESPVGLLFYRVRVETLGYVSGRAASEIPVDLEDPVACRGLCPLLPSGCALVELPDYLSKMVDALPEQERAALLLMLDGLTPRSMAEHLGCGDSTAVRLADAAVLLLQIDNPELSSREPVTLESLPKWEQRALLELGPERRAALLRLESVPRQAMLLKHQGAANREIRERLDLSYDAVLTLVRCVPAQGGRAASKAKSPGRRPKSKFAQIADALRSDIKGMQPGDRLPRRLDLMERFGVGSRTVDNAWAVLRAEGLIEANGVYGYTVARVQGDLGQAA